MKIAIIIGSTRPSRIGPQLAGWLLTLLKTDQELHDAEFSIVDLASFPLPMFQEPAHPMMVQDLAQFTSPAAVSWNQEIAKHDAYIVVSPEYHSGIPGTLKNAIDHLYHAWIGKPVMILTYGIFGGAQANSQLRQVLGFGCRMKVATICPTLEFPGRDEGENNTSPALFQALAGTLGADTLESWEGKKQDILSGCHELLG
ncbi:uncharacterized protein E0L32_007058 [Thyridium curvatum]|uniref:NADPH-dependent FMN reductase-like domain-containing protein n=1 Tax=Thyridium curvatum TaxID=1093900 RepID=A0A507AQC0_9PEZI|nr:uncharacterized protein E0L32_007058 [Thyridium curvatum]TPX12172.1 hypothetical protein E0L32_007058 [Thyridium curvatum]